MYASSDALLRKRLWKYNLWSIHAHGAAASMFTPGCRVFTAIKSTCHRSVALFPKAAARIRSCVNATLQTAPLGIQAPQDADAMKTRCATLYNNAVLAKHDGAAPPLSCSIRSAVNDP
jgi:hypothetical protein